MGVLSAIGDVASGIGKAVGGVASGVGQVAGGVLQGVGKAGNAYLQGVGQYNRQQLLLRELEVVAATTPEDSKARVKAVREVAAKYGLNLPTNVKAYQRIPTPYEEALKAQTMDKPKRASAKERAQTLSVLENSRPFNQWRAYDPEKDKGEEPWSAAEVYDPNDPEHAEWKRQFDELTASSGGPTDGQTSGGTQPGFALRSIPTDEQWLDRYRPGWRPEQQDAAPATEPQPQTARPGGWLSKLLGSRTPGMSASHIMGNPLSAEDAARTRRQVDQALTTYENAGGVTTRNAGQVQQSQAAPTDALKAAARAVKAYKASPDYLQMCRDTGRLLNETDLSGPMKEVLAGQPVADQKRLLKLIHKHGEKAVMHGVANQAPSGGRM